MSIVTVGSIAFDSVRTPFGGAERELGGSAVHSALAASFFTPVRVVGPVGDDFGPEQRGALERAGVDTADIDHIEGARTFFWRGRYEFDLSTAHTEEIQLSVFDGWTPKLSEEARAAEILFLGAMDPEAQAGVRNQWQGAKWSALDSIHHWIETKREALIEVIRTVDIVLLSDQEARELTGSPMLLAAAREIHSWGPLAVVIKHGEYGCSLLSNDGYFSLPGYPLEAAADPTGTGDAFAGGFLGYLDLISGDKLTEGVLRRAVTYGSVMASFCVEEFGPRRVARLTESEVNSRFDEFREMTHFEHVSTSPKRRRGEMERGKWPLDEPHRTAGTRGFDEPRHTGGTPAYGAPSHTGGTPTYEPPRPSDRPPTLRP